MKYFIFFIFFIISIPISTLLHELFHVIVFNIQNISIILINFCGINIIDNKIKLGFCGFGGTTIANIKECLKHYGYKITTKKIINNIIATNILTLMSFLLMFISFIFIKIFYIKAFFLSISIVLLFILIGSFCDSGDFSIAKKVRNNKKVFYSLCCIPEILLGYDTDFYMEVEKELMFININNKEDLSLLNYIINYAISVKADINLNIIEKIRSLNYSQNIIYKMLLLKLDLYFLLSNKANVILNYEQECNDKSKFIRTLFYQNKKLLNKKNLKTEKIVLEPFEKIYSNYKFYRSNQKKLSSIN